MLRAFQRGEITIPNAPHLLSDLHSVEKQVTAAGNVRYAASRSDGGHADRFMALALALHAGDTRPPELTVRVIRPRTRRFLRPVTVW